MNKEIEDMPLMALKGYNGTRIGVYLDGLGGDKTEGTVQCRTIHCINAYFFQYGEGDRNAMMELSDGHFVELPGEEGTIKRLKGL